MGKLFSKPNMEEIVRRLKDPDYANTRCECVDVDHCKWRDRNVSIDKGLLKFEWETELWISPQCHSSSSCMVRCDPRNIKCLMALINADIKISIK